MCKGPAEGMLVKLKEDGSGEGGSVAERQQAGAGDRGRREIGMTKAHHAWPCSHSEEFRSYFRPEDVVNWVPPKQSLRQEFGAGGLLGR